MADSRTPRDGRPIEEIGHYSPVLPNEPRVMIALDRVEYWLGQGAELTETVRSLVKRVKKDAQKN